MAPIKNLVFLPATEPGNQTYGTVPEMIADHPEITVTQVTYPELVWYNQAVQAEAISQIQALGVSPIVLIGFSKSGLGAWNIARAIPDRVCATIIFDSPMVRKTLPTWGTAPFYHDDAEWQRDLPVLSIHDYQAAMPNNHRLVLISGEGFHDEMSEMSQELLTAGIQHTFLSRPSQKHHWNSGWIEEGLDALCPGNAEPQLGHSYPGNAEPQLGTSPRTEWYSRGYLPHRDRLGLLQSITFRLADSLPRSVLGRLETELSLMPESKRDVHKRASLDAYLDAGQGCCALRHPAMAEVVQETFLKFDGSKYRLIAWCIMPNHVHIVIEPLITLGKIVQSWKSYTGRWAMSRNAELGLGVPGKQLWMREYWDRFIRDEKHLTSVIDYIHQNPVKAGLCSSPDEWPYSSATNQLPGNAEPQLGHSPQRESNSPDNHD